MFPFYFPWWLYFPQNKTPKYLLVSPHFSSAWWCTLRMPSGVSYVSLKVCRQVTPVQPHGGGCLCRVWQVWEDVSLVLEEVCNSFRYPKQYSSDQLKQVVSFHESFSILQEKSWTSLVAQWIRIICQCKGHGSDPWSRKIPHTADQLSPCTMSEPALWSLWAATT